MSRVGRGRVHSAQDSRPRSKGRPLGTAAPRKPSNPFARQQVLLTAGAKRKKTSARRVWPQKVLVVELLLLYPMDRMPLRGTSC